MKKEHLLDIIAATPDETLLWAGRPAPRCFTFRNWRQSLVGLGLTLPCLFWQIVGIELAAAGAPAWVAWLPLPFLLGTLWLAGGHLFAARIEWEHLFYALTDRHLYLQSGLYRIRQTRVERSAITGIERRDYGQCLATFTVSTDRGSLRLCCLEEPDLFLRALAGEAPVPQSESQQ